MLLCGCIIVGSKVVFLTVSGSLKSAPHFRKVTFLSGQRLEVKGDGWDFTLSFTVNIHASSSELHFLAIGLSTVSTGEDAC